MKLRVDWKVDFRFMGTNQTKHTKRLWWIIGLLALPFSVLIAASPQKVEKTWLFQTNTSPRISLSNLTGHVVVRGWDKAQVRALCATTSPQVTIDTDPLPTIGSTDKIHFATRVMDPTLTGPSEMVDYLLDVPLDSSVEIRNRQGSVQIQKLLGDTWVESVGGDVSVTDSGGHLAVRTVGGTIEIVRCSGRIETSSITGNLHFVSPTSSKLRGTTTSGKITYEGDFAPGGDYVLSVYSGDMDIICPPSSSFELNAKSLRGKVVTDPEFSLIPKRRPGNPPSGSSAVFGSHNSGTAMVELTSFSGSIHIIPQPFK